MLDRASDPNGVIIRRINGDKEIEEASKLCFEVFNAFNATVGLPAEFPRLSDAKAMITARSDPSGSYVCLVAVTPDGRVVGTNATNLGGTVSTVGPIAVAQEMWDKKLGRALMQAVIDEGTKNGKTCIMLQQVCNNTASFSLYLSLGFRPIENCLYMTGLVDEKIPFPADKYSLRRMEPDDAVVCDSLFSEAVGREGSPHRCSRLTEFQESIQNERGDPAAGQYVLLESGSTPRVAAYITSVTLGGHIVARDAEACKALLIGVSQRMRSYRQQQQSENGKSPALFLHMLGRLYPDLSAWALRDARLRLVRQTTIMAWGPGPVPTPDPAAPFIYCPSIDY